ncbi:hypothetical protein phiOC_p181 [Ochrobactrum phage vB_OspM_OC]|nr:hypothetical protein phiOC_p181 [Ochrobactrum phage vB_OspM_OC]
MKKFEYKIISAETLNEAQDKLNVEGAEGWDIGFAYQGVAMTHYIMKREILANKHV